MADDRQSVSCFSPKRTNTSAAADPMATALPLEGEHFLTKGQMLPAKACGHRVRETWERMVGGNTNNA